MPVYVVVSTILPPASCCLDGVSLDEALLLSVAAEAISIGQRQ